MKIEIQQRPISQGLELFEACERTLHAMMSGPDMAIDRLSEAVELQGKMAEWFTSALGNVKFLRSLADEIIAGEVNMTAAQYEEIVSATIGTSTREEAIGYVKSVLSLQECHMALLAELEAHTHKLMQKTNELFKGSDSLH